MIKSELIAELGNSRDYLSCKDAAEIVNLFFNFIAEELIEGNRLELRGFGTFKIKNKPGRVGRNPKTGIKVEIPPKAVAYFKPGKDLKE
jgi:integration host factor subunit beta